MSACCSRGTLYALPLALLTLLPLVVVLASFLAPQPEIWVHLARYVLPDVLLNTGCLLLGVGLGTLFLGSVLAWLTAVCDFPGRRFFSWALMLPLAMPAYVLAFVLLGLFDFTGPVQTFLRAHGGLIRFPSIRSTGGVILTLTLAFYPYVYLLAREAFLAQGRRALEAAQMLGCSRIQAFWTVALPMARPWLAGGVMLVLMESLADFGTVAIFNFDTFTTAIYKSWFALFNLPAAAQLASLLVCFVLLLALLENRSRGARHFHGRGGQGGRIVLRGVHCWLAILLCLSVLLCAFGLPVLQLLVWTARIWREDFDSRYPGFVFNSLVLSALTALAVTLAALWLVHLVRRFKDFGTRGLSRIAILGYAVPGTVLAVGVFIPVAILDDWLAQWTGSALLKGSLLVMLLAVASRFLAVAHQPVDAAMQRISQNQENAARSLGVTGRGLLWRVHLPLLRGGLLSALLLVFVETMKEMPITLMTRPFGWDTLAVRVFEMTSEGMWERAALPSLCIVLVGLLPVWLLIRQMEK